LHEKLHSLEKPARTGIKSGKDKKTNPRGSPSALNQPDWTLKKLWWKGKGMKRFLARLKPPPFNYREWYRVCHGMGGTPGHENRPKGQQP